MEPIQIFDTTLRDGTQGENISFTNEEKLRIAQKLDKTGIHYIECGWPGSNPATMEFFKLALKESFETSIITAFGATRKQGITAGEDSNLKALIECGAPAITLFGKTWDLHIEEIMSNTLSENLDMIYESVAYIKKHDREVLYNAEHFFDG